MHRATTSAYDLAGNRIGLTDAQGRITTYSYDAANRLTGITDSRMDGSGCKLHLYAGWPAGQYERWKRHDDV